MGNCNLAVSSLIAPHDSRCRRFQAIIFNLRSTLSAIQNAMIHLRPQG